MDDRPASIAIAALGPATRADFDRVHSPENGEGWCRCVAWWVPTWDGWGDRTAEANRRVREDLFARGESDGHLLYADGEPVGWCQNGPRDRFKKLVRQYGLEPSPGTWAISCFIVVPRRRGRGLAHEFLRLVLADLSARGVRHVQAFPRCGSGLSAGHVWTGPESVYRKAGFVDELPHPTSPVLGRSL